MNDLDTRLAVEVGLVYKAANEGKDVTIEAVAALEAIIAETCTAARLDEWQRMAEAYPTAPYIPDFIWKERVADLNQPKESV